MINISFSVHCEWNDWVEGECSKECGGGMKTNTRTEKVSAEHGGEECPGPDSEEVSCNEHECPGIHQEYINDSTNINSIRLYEIVLFD